MEFSSSLMSEKIDNKKEMIESKEKYIQFKNKFGESVEPVQAYADNKRESQQFKARDKENVVQ